MNKLHKILYGCGQKLRGLDVIERLKQLQGMEKWTHNDIKRFQVEKLKRLVSHAYHNVTFYRKLWDQAGVTTEQIKSLEDLSRLPKVTKRLLVQAGELSLDQRYPKTKFLQGRSSGSTGESFIYYKDKAHYSWFIAGALLGWTWAGWNIGERWIRLQFRGNIGLRARIEDYVFNCLYMPIDRLDAGFMQTFVEKAIRFKPTLLRGYAGGTYVLAQFLLENKETRLRPKAVVCTGDTLYPHYRQTIEQAFDCKVFDAYGGEGMAVANQCQNGQYHILPSVLVELEAEGPATQEGQPGRIILTSLTNYAMPMIRYDIADIAIMGDECSCGYNWSTLKKIIGRETDIIITPSGRKLVCHHFNNIIREIDGIDQYQIYQSQLSQLILRLVVNQKYSRSVDESYLIENVSKIAGTGLRVKIEYSHSLPLPPSGKRRYIISEISQSTKKLTPD